MDVFLAGFNYYHGQIINTALHLSRTTGRRANVAVGACRRSVCGEQEVSDFFSIYSFLTGELDLPRLTPGATSCRVQPNDPACIANMSDNGRNACMCSGQYRADYWKPYWFFCRCSGETMLLIK